MSEYDGRDLDDGTGSSTAPPDDCGCDGACDADADTSASTGSGEELSPPKSGSDTARAEFGVPEMDCPSCAGKVESSVRRLDGIDDIDPRVTTGRLVVDYDPNRTTVDDIRTNIEGAGYAVEDEPSTRRITLSVPDMDCPSCAGRSKMHSQTRPAYSTTRRARRQGRLSSPSQQTLGRRPSSPPSKTPATRSPAPMLTNSSETATPATLTPNTRASGGVPAP